MPITFNPQLGCFLFLNKKKNNNKIVVKILVLFVVIGKLTVFDFIAVGAGKSPAEIRAQMEANLRAQRLALQGT